jgi:hypothetical protein
MKALIHESISCSALIKVKTKNPLCTAGIFLFQEDLQAGLLLENHSVGKVFNYT